MLNHGPRADATTDETVRKQGVTVTKGSSMGSSAGSRQVASEKHARFFALI